MVRKRAGARIAAAAGPRQCPQRAPAAACAGACANHDAGARAAAVAATQKEDAAEAAVGGRPRVVGGRARVSVVRERPAPGVRGVAHRAGLVRRGRAVARARARARRAAVAVVAVLGALQRLDQGQGAPRVGRARAARARRGRGLHLFAQAVGARGVPGGRPNFAAP